MSIVGARMNDCTFKWNTARMEHFTAGLGTNCSNVREHELEFGSSRTSELTNTGFFKSNEL